MKTLKKTKKTKTSASTHKHASPSHHNTSTATEASSEIKDWSSSISKKFLSNYAIPFTRLVEAKLISLQAKV